MARTKQNVIEPSIVHAITSVAILKAIKPYVANLFDHWRSDTGMGADLGGPVEYTEMGTTFLGYMLDNEGLSILGLEPGKPNEDGLRAIVLAAMGVTPTAFNISPALACIPRDGMVFALGVYLTHAVPQALIEGDDE